ncbi:RPA-interacting protein-like isoform X3 [Pomacea canaliculata]|nr:RPA-interacting protein-like isoform X3 [Pomacea canaliculata]
MMSDNKCPESSVVAHRKAMYKVTSAPWRDAYRERCLKRLHESRDVLISKRRGLDSDILEKDQDTKNSQFIKTLMSDELKMFRDEKKEDAEMEMWDPDCGEIDVMLSVFEDIQQELRMEEVRLLKEYEVYAESLRAEEAALCSAIEQLGRGEIICPLCEKHSLLENKGVIFCKCGLRIDTEQDSIGLEFVRQQLQSAGDLHHCETHPQFSVVEDYGCSNLVMT